MAHAWLQLHIIALLLVVVVCNDEHEDLLEQIRELEAAQTSYRLALWHTRDQLREISHQLEIAISAASHANRRVIEVLLIKVNYSTAALG
jgi:hypothetical protein